MKKQGTLAVLVAAAVAMLATSPTHAWPGGHTVILFDGDGFEDLEIDDFAGHWLVQTRRAGCPDWLRGARARSIYWKRLGEKIAPRWIAGQKVTRPFGS